MQTLYLVYALVPAILTSMVIGSMFLNITGCLNIIWLVYLKTIIIPLTKLISACQCNITRLNLLALSEEPMLSSGFKAFQRGVGRKYNRNRK